MRLTIVCMRVLLAALSLAFPRWVSAETMQCFGGAIDDAEIDRPTRRDVERRCGEPDQMDGNVWVYHKSQFSYRLRFDADGKLYLIQRSHRE